MVRVYYYQYILPQRVMLCYESIKGGPFVLPIYYTFCFILRDHFEIEIKSVDSQKRTPSVFSLNWMNCAFRSNITTTCQHQREQ